MTWQQRRMDARHKNTKFQTSSKKMMAGAAVRARLNTAERARSESPSHLLSSSGPCTWRNVRAVEVVRGRVRTRKKREEDKQHAHQEPRAPTTTLQPKYLG